MDVLQILTMLGTVLVTVLAAFGVASAKLAKINKIKDETLQAYTAVEALVKGFKDALDEASPGGKKIAQEEVPALLGKLGTVVTEAWDVIKAIKEPVSEG